MRFIHTSDWHLGRSLHGEPLLEHQRTFLGWLTDLAVERRADAVLVAGDVYDRAVPGTDAVRVLDEALVGLVTAGVAVVMISGNHDSAIRLGFGSALHELAGVHVRTRVCDLATPAVLHDESGALAVYGIPYLLPDAAMEDLGAERSHRSVLSAAVGRIRADAAARGIDRTVVLAHAFVTGAAQSESERDIRVGGIGDAPASVFEAVTYTALGHLHRQQHIGDRIGYCGSPLAFSFSERDHVKSVTLIDIDGEGAVRNEVVPAPTPRPLREVRGRLEELLARGATDLADLADAWVKVVLTDPARPHAPMERLRERWPHTLMLDFRPEETPTDSATELARLREMTEPVEICAAFVEWVDSTRPTASQRHALQSVIDAVARAELSA